MRCTSSNCESVFMLFVRTMCAPAMKAESHEALLLEVSGLSSKVCYGGAVDQRTIPETTNMRCTSSNCESVFMLFVRTMCAPAMKAESHEALLLEVFGLS